ncbi:hypothetical protein [Myxococcus fulvus]|uniref:hypothetical protein n=1 Tax=Myxococcus fulvus TaxID=33 RepID=UPI0020C14968|nr:hypothetical protein [Myxococcus fulvus]MCK8499037.1 hypothetical protein [Myxococcus fulvus]
MSSAVSEVAPTCAVHPLEDSVFVCDRCGSFGCAGCRAHPEAARCAPCVRRIREDPTAMAPTRLLRDACSLLLQHQVLLVGLFILQWLCLMGSGALLHLTQSTLPGVMFLVAAGLGLSIFLMRAVARRLREEAGLPALDVSSPWVVLARIPLLLLTYVLTFLVILGGSFLLVLPGVYMALCTSLAPAAVAVDGKGPLAALRFSYQLVRGHRRRLLSALLPVLILMPLSDTLGSLLTDATEHLPAPFSFAANLVAALMVMASVSLHQFVLVLAYQRLLERQPVSPSSTERT